MSAKTTTNSMNMSRRKFLKTTGIVGGGLVVGFSLAGCAPGELPIDLSETALYPTHFYK
jgi:hypothetical protein|tara:strand:+ start:2678 stop:2854 length:177 start_codon:yes stop_codon:yes gene_type:complete